MPTPGQTLGQQNTAVPPEFVAELQQRSGHIRGAGMGAMSQAESVLAAQVAALCDEVRELRRMLAPPSAVILTGADVQRQFAQLGCTCLTNQLGPDYCTKHAA